MIVLLNNAEKWDECIEKAYYPYISYKFDWLRSIAEHYLALKFIPYVSVGEHDEISYACPLFVNTVEKEITSTPFLSPGFITKNIEPIEILEKLSELVGREGCKRILLQIPPGYAYANSLLRYGFRMTAKICFFNLDISGVESFDTYLERHITKDKRKNVNTANRRGVKAEILVPSQSVLDRFYPFYLEMGNRRNAKLLEKSFIGCLADSLHDNCRYWIAVVDNQDVGSAITFEFANRLWSWFLQSDRAYKEYKVDDFLYGQIVRYGFEKHLEIIDFGTSPYDGSLADFKRRFGAKPIFHELYELDLSWVSFVKKIFLDMRRLTKARRASR